MAANSAAQQHEEPTPHHVAVIMDGNGRWDPTEAARRLAREPAAGRLDPEEITETDMARALTTAEMPGADLLVRTGGERRISHFLLWDAAYAELYLSELLWPETTAELDRAFEFYAHRQRRFGRTSDQVEAASC